MKKTFFNIFLLFLFLYNAAAQNSLSFYHLGNTTYQNSELNPAWLKESKYFIGVPVLSNIHLHLNSKLSYNNIVNSSSDGTEQIVDVETVLSRLQRNNLLNITARVGLLSLGYSPGKGSMLSFFVNERIEANIFYPKDIVELYVNGNNDLLGEEGINFKGLQTSVNWYREIGLGYAYQINPNVRFGVRGKYLLGLANLKRSNDFNFNFSSDEKTFAINVNSQDAYFNTAGENILQGNSSVDLASHLTFPKNSGFGLDIGIESKISSNSSLAVSLLDIGFIKWKEDVKKRMLPDTTFEYAGVGDFDALGNDFINKVVDSLINKNLKIKEDDVTPYTSWLPLKVYVSWIRHLDKTTDIYITGATNFTQRQIKAVYGVGVTKKLVGNKITVSGSLLKLPQQFVNLGGAFTIRGGPVQFYIAADHIVNFSVLDLKSIDLRFGINLLFLDREEEVSGSVYRVKKRQYLSARRRSSRRR